MFKKLPLNIILFVYRLAHLLNYTLYMNLRLKRKSNRALKLHITTVSKQIFLTIKI